MQLAKAFDPSPLITALKAKGIKDAEQLVNDELPVIFDWLNSSVAMEATSIPLLSGIAPIILNELESVATQKLADFEKTIGG